jgi:hypothetical protein
MATTGYNIDGSLSSSGIKYKWIGLKFTKDELSFDSANNINYLNIYDKMSSYFETTTLNKLKDSNESNVIGFIDIGSKFGDLSRGFNSLSTWFSQPSINKKLSDLFSSDSNYGSIHTESATKWGPVVNPNQNNIANGIFIFIGLNNTVSL